VQLKGVATTSASVCCSMKAWCGAFQNQRQIGGLLGFAPAHYDSGDSSRDQGITRAGNQERFGRGKRARRVGIVALARKLLIALWRYATTGVLPAGAVLKAA
jgi:transposase